MKKLIIGIVVVVLIYQGGKWTYGEAAVAYFNHKCETESGEFIYRTVENVEGLYQMRLRDPRDYFDRLRKGDIPEDPYGHTNTEAQRPWLLFVRNPENHRYLFIESEKQPDLKNYDSRRYKEFIPKPIFTGEKYWKYMWNSNSDFGSIYSAVQIPKIKSKYGFTWQETRDFWDKFFRVWGGELIVLELSTEEVLGLKKGFVLINLFSKLKGEICPKDKNDNSTYNFIKKILVPATKNNLIIEDE